jgi:hypothetical protein
MTLENKTIKNPVERERIYGQRDHLRKYGKDYHSRLSHSGLLVQENHFVRSLSKETQQKHGLAQNEIIYFCKKGSSTLP